MQLKTIIQFISICSLAVFSQVRPSDQYCQRFPDDEGCAGYQDTTSQLNQQNDSHIKNGIENSVPENLVYDVKFESLKDLLAQIHQCKDEANDARTKKCEKAIISKLSKPITGKRLLLEKGDGAFYGDEIFASSEKVMDGIVHTSDGMKLSKKHPSYIDVTDGSKKFLFIGFNMNGISYMFESREKMKKICDVDCMKRSFKSGYVIYYGYDINVGSGAPIGITVFAEFENDEDAANWIPSNKGMIVIPFSQTISNNYLTILAKVKSIH